MLPTEEIEKLTFNRFIMTIGNLPSSYVESLSYYECMLWLCDYLQNTVIPAVNNNGEVVEELQGLYVQLKNYVDSYFDNLDVQQEINTKLDNMASSGELTALIKNYIDPIQEAFETSINEEISSFKTSVNTQISDIDNKVDSVANGSPKGVYATLAALEAADPDHDYIYLVSADGKWYYYTNNAWTAGGTYQATSIADESIFVDNFEENIQDRTKENVDYRKIATYTTQYGKCMNNSYQVADGYGFYLVTINVKENDVINIKMKVNSSDNKYAYLLMNNTTFVSGVKMADAPLVDTIYTTQVTIPSGVNKIVLNLVVRADNEITFANVVSTKELQDNDNNVLNVLAPYTNMTPIETANSYISVSETTGALTKTPNSGFLYKKYDIEDIDELKVHYYNQSGRTVYAIIIANSSDVTIEAHNYQSLYTNNTYYDVNIIVPDGGKYLYIQAGSTYDLYASKREYLNTASILNTNDDPYIEFDIENLERRCSNLEDQNPFEWKEFDKTYFAFVIDDNNSYFPKAVEIFHTNSVPLSSATLVNKLDEVYTTYTPSNVKTVKQLLQDMVADGGEVLSHYTGNLAPAGTPDSGGTHYLTTEEDWLERTRNVKKTLEDNGFVVRGIMAADSTLRRTSTGQKYCQLYFDYSDGLGTSKNFDIRRKMFLSDDMQTLDQVKAYIDQCCQTPGFYPLCFHGTRLDEPMITEENLTAILAYIAAKGSSVCECSTYAAVFDEFKSTKLAEDIKALQ